MTEQIDQQSLEKISESAFMSRDNPEITKQGIKHNSNELTKLINKLDKDIWIKEFWYSMKEHISQKFPGQI